MVASWSQSIVRWPGLCGTIDVVIPRVSAPILCENHSPCRQIPPHQYSYTGQIHCEGKGQTEVTKTNTERGKGQEGSAFYWGFEETTCRQRWEVDQVEAGNVW